MWKDRKKRNSISRFFGSPLFLSLVLLGLLAAIIAPLYKNISSRYRIDREIEDLRQEINSLETSNKDLEKLLAYLESDQFAEAEARLNFGLRKKGEEVVVIKEEGAAIGSVNEKTAGGDLSNPAKWLKYFFGK